MKKHIILLLALFYYSCLFSQTITLSGYVTDEGGESLVSANIYITEQKIGTTTNEYGFYTLSFNYSDSIILQISYIGYTTEQHCLKITNDTLLNFDLSVQTMQEVVVLADKTDKTIPDIGIVKLSIKQIKQIPNLAGEVDIIKALAFTPGVVNGIEGSSGLFVRGGSPDQNLILLDDAVVYNPNHLFGFLSVFNPDAVKNVQLTKSGFPTNYGGRLSSVLEVTTKEGNQKALKGQFSLGLLSSKVTLEGPLIKDKMSFMVSARSAYLSVLLLPFRVAYNQGDISEYSNYFMTDANLKWNYKPNNRQRFHFSFYTGNDTYKYFEQLGGDNTTNEAETTLGWGNLTATFRYTQLLSKKIFWKNTIVFSKFQYVFSQSQEETITNEHQKQTWENLSRLWNIGLKSTINHPLNQSHNLQYGIHVNSTTFFPEKSTFTTLDTLLENPNQVYPTWEAAVFLEDKWQLGKHSNLFFGLRYALFSPNAKIYQSLEPRIIFSQQLTPTLKAKLAFSKMWQPIHLLPTTNPFGLSNEIWIPSTVDIPPQEADHFSIGITKIFSKPKIEFSGEVYYKMLNNMIAFREGQRVLFSLEQVWEDFIAINGKGRSYGFEFFANKTTGKLTGLFAYTYAKHTRQFDNLNNGEVFPFRYDYRHDLSLTTAYAFNQYWNFSASWVFRSGQPFTKPITTFYDASQNVSFLIFGTRNGERLPVYHRGDLMFSHTKKTKRNNQRTWSFSIYNFYNRKNVHYIGISNERQKDGSLLQTMQLYSLIPILPSVNYGLAF